MLAVLVCAVVITVAGGWRSASAAQGMPRPALIEEAVRPGQPTNADTAFSLARRLEHGEGVEQNLSGALELYCKAAFAGHAAAAHSIGWIYLNGRGGTQSDGLAVAWLKVALERGHDVSGNLLALLPEIGDVDHREGCPESTRPSDRWQSTSTAKLEELAPREIKDIAARWARQFDLDPNLILAVIKVESAFRPDAVSSKQAQGLMQLIPATASRFGVEDVFDVSENVRGGTEYLRWLVDHFDGDLKLALAGYNSGEGAVTRYGGVPPFPETQHYLRKIYRLYDHPDLRDADKWEVAQALPVQVSAEMLALGGYLKSR